LGGLGAKTAEEGVLRFVGGADGGCGRQGIVIRGLIIVGVDRDVGGIAHLAYPLHQRFLTFRDARGRRGIRGGRVWDIGSVWNEDGLGRRGKWAAGRSARTEIFGVDVVPGAFWGKTIGV